MRPLCLIALVALWIACTVPVKSSGTAIQAAISSQSRAGSDASVIEASDAHSQQLVKRSLIPRFVGKRTAQEEESEFENSDLVKTDGAIRNAEVDKRGPLLYLLRSLKHEPLELLRDALDDAGSDSSQAHSVSSRESSGGPKSIKIQHLGPRNSAVPLFLGRRRAPFFVGKRAARPYFVGKRRAPYFVGKKDVSPFFVGKKGQPYFVGKRDINGGNNIALDGENAARQKREAYFGDVGEEKRAWNSYIPWPEIRGVYHINYRSSPYQVKRFIIPKFIGKRNNPQSISAILKALKALEYARQRRRSLQKKPYYAPLFVGRRNAPSDVQFRLQDNYQMPMTDENTDNESYDL
ncbi:hypothetical protein ScPMuIL_008176 [Solemya velum]